MRTYRNIVLANLRISIKFYIILLCYYCITIYYYIYKYIYIIIFYCSLQILMLDSIHIFTNLM